jgi:hypothetical protein
MFTDRDLARTNSNVPLDRLEEDGLGSSSSFISRSFPFRFFEFC